VRLGEVAKVALGGKNYSITSTYNGRPREWRSGIATDTNALETAQAVRNTLAEPEPFFPLGVRVVY